MPTSEVKQEKLLAVHRGSGSQSVQAHRKISTAHQGLDSWAARRNGGSPGVARAPDPCLTGCMWLWESGELQKRRMMEGPVYGEGEEETYTLVAENEKMIESDTSLMPAEQAKYHCNLSLWRIGLVIQCQDSRG